MDDPVFDAPPPAAMILADRLAIDSAAAISALKSLVEAGYVIAPREPTNAMLAAYMEALGQPTRNHGCCIRNIGKARKRWRAMATAGTAMALSRKMLLENP